MGTRKAIVWAAAAITFAAGAWGVLAQVRSGVSIRQPGQFSSPLDNSAVGYFRQYSFGLGALQSPSMSSYSNPLRSAVESRAVYDITRPGGGAPPLEGRSLMNPAPTAARLYQPSAGLRTDLGGGGYGASSVAASSRLLKATSSYLNSLGGEHDMGLAGRMKPVDSLASGGNDAFSTYMSQGEKAFRAGDFENALEQFKLANGIEPKNPESLISLTHACFALSRNAYSRSAYYLSRAIKYLPELPLAPLQPKSFFPSPQQYAERIGWLDKHLETSPFDNEAFLVAAYFHWFDGDVDGAASGPGQGPSREDQRRLPRGHRCVLGRHEGQRQGQRHLGRLPHQRAVRRPAPIVPACPPGRAGALCRTPRRATPSLIASVPPSSPA